MAVDVQKQIERIMAERQVRRVPVIDAGGAPASYALSSARRQASQPSR